VLGAFDPVAELAPICRKHNVWLHVDGAWGGPALFSKRLEKFTAGFEQADSVTFDAHKLFGASLTCSFFLTRHNEILLKANDVSGADYLFHADDASLDRGRLSWQCGRGADAVSFWAIWKSLGSKGLGEFVDRLLNIRDETVAWVKTQDRLELIAEPDYLNICVRVAPPLHAPSASRADWSKQVREQLKNNDQAMVNFSANVDGTFLRLILANPYLQFEHVRQLLTWALEV
jgi:glutamate decarboxylase/sulfinoalanine decarboxylase